MDCRFVVGQKVVCIDDLFDALAYKRSEITLPKRGVIYTVRDIIIEEFLDGAIPAIYLKEIKNPIFKYFLYGTPITPHEIPFAAHRFRPLTEDDIEDEKKKTAPFDFNKLLKPSDDFRRKVEEEEEAYV